jgi:hypothetical protein
LKRGDGESYGVGTFSGNRKKDPWFKLKNVHDYGWENIVDQLENKYKERRLLIATYRITIINF